MGVGGIVGQVVVEPGDDLDLGYVLLLAFLVPVLAYGIVALGAMALSRREKQRKLRDPSARKPIPDWYPDPWGTPYQRWWNGDTWTAAVREHPWSGPVAPWVPPPAAGRPPEPGSAPAPGDHLPPG